MKYRIVLEEGPAGQKYIVQNQTTDCRNDTYFEDDHVFSTLPEAQRYIESKRRPTRTVLWEGEA